MNMHEDLSSLAKLVYAKHAQCVFESVEELAAQAADIVVNEDGMPTIPAEDALQTAVSNVEATVKVKKNVQHNAANKRLKKKNKIAKKSRARNRG